MYISRYGVDIANIRMEDFKILKKEIASNISKYVLTVANGTLLTVFRPTFVES